MAKKTSSKTLETSYIVSGFPRSGTTLMMRCLEAGGLEILLDPDRKESKNEVDRFGDYELVNFGKDVAKHGRNWTAGKVFKIVAPFIYWIPKDRPVKVIFMLRDINEIITSLLAMKVIWEFDPVHSIQLARDFLIEKKFPTLFVQLTDLVKYPKSTCTMLAEFIERDLDIDAMVAVTKVKGRKQQTTYGGLLSFEGIPKRVDDPLAKTKGPNG